MKKLNLAISFALLIICLTTSARIQTDDVITMKRVYTAGDKDRYLIEMKTLQTVAEGTKKTNYIVKLLMVLREVTKEVKPNGNVVITGSFEKANVKLQDKGTDQEQDLMSFAPSWTETRDKNSKVLESKIAGADNVLAQQLANGISEIVAIQVRFYSPKPVKIGDEWKIEPGEMKDKEDKFSGSAKLTGKEKIHDIETYKITVASDKETTQPEKVKAHFEGKGNIDIKDGKIVKMTGKVKYEGGTIKSSEFTLSRLIGDEEPKMDGK